MADYRDLLRRAVDALPENNGNARRQVYDKARAALRKQLDAIQPELPSREKTHHRLQLEECIREVEQEATERMLSGLSGLSHYEQEHFVPRRADDYKDEADEVAAPVAPEPQPAPVPVYTPRPAEPPKHSYQPQPEPKPEPEPEPEGLSEETDVSDAEPMLAAASEAAFEPAEPDIAVQFARTADEEPAPKADVAVSQPRRDHVRPDTSSVIATPSLVDAEDVSAAAMEAAVSRLGGMSELPGRSSDAPEIGAISEDRTDKRESTAARLTAKMSSFVPRFGNGRKDKDVAVDAAMAAVLEADAETQELKPEPVAPAQTPAAMHTEREVELDGAPESDATPDLDENDPQLAIDHAIEVLDREASGKGVLTDAKFQTQDAVTSEVSFASVEDEDEGGGNLALMIFLVLVLLLLAGMGGASYWAWREGYVDFSNLFGTSDTANVNEASTPTLDAPATTTNGNVRTIGTDAETSSGPGNTAATPGVVETPATGLESSPVVVETDPALPLVPTGTDTVDGAGEVGNTTSPEDAAAAASSIAEPAALEDKSADRLPVSEDTATPEQPVESAATVPEVVTAGSQSLLLEASDQADSGAVAFSGTVDWSRGVDELGVPTLEGKADIPARNLSVSLLIRKNSDASLPASHLIEVDFDISDSFIGGGISRIAGILLKNDELGQGVQLVGASARVVANSFLFALSAAPQDVTANSALLKSRKWLDLAIIYSTGKQALLTLEKDDASAALFDEVVAAWTSADGT